MQREVIADFSESAIPANRGGFEILRPDGAGAELPGLASCSATRPKAAVQFSRRRLTAHVGPGLGG